MLASRDLPSDSTFVLKSESGKLDIKRREPSILFYHFTHFFTLQTSDHEVIFDFLLIRRHSRRHSKSATSS